MQRNILSFNLLAEAVQAILPPDFPASVNRREHTWHSHRLSDEEFFAHSDPCSPPLRKGTFLLFPASTKHAVRHPLRNTCLDSGQILGPVNISSFFYDAKRTTVSALKGQNLLLSLNTEAVVKQRINTKTGKSTSDCPWRLGGKCRNWWTGLPERYYAAV